MGHSRLALMALAMACIGASSHAQVFPVTGFDEEAKGLAGDTVFVDLIYDYGAGFPVIAEDLQFEYEFAHMTFNLGASTIDVFGAPQSLPDYTTQLRQFAIDHQGGVLVNPDVPGTTPAFKGYALSFFTADGTPQVRSGDVTLRVAFDIHADADVGRYAVLFTDRNVIVDEDGNEFSYPRDIRPLFVTVVPEPQIALMLLPGLALVGLYARRRGSPRR